MSKTGTDPITASNVREASEADECRNEIASQYRVLRRSRRLNASPRSLSEDKISLKTKYNKNGKRQTSLVQRPSNINPNANKKYPQNVESDTVTPPSVKRQKAKKNEAENTETNVVAISTESLELLPTIGNMSACETSSQAPEPSGDMAVNNTTVPGAESSPTGSVSARRREDTTSAVKVNSVKESCPMPQNLSHPLSSIKTTPPLVPCASELFNVKPISSFPLSSPSKPPCSLNEKPHFPISSALASATPSTPLKTSGHTGRAERKIFTPSFNSMATSSLFNSPPVTISTATEVPRFPDTARSTGSQTPIKDSQHLYMKQRFTERCSTPTLSTPRRSPMNEEGIMSPFSKRSPMNQHSSPFASPRASPTYSFNFQAVTPTKIVQRKTCGLSREGTEGAALAGEIGCRNEFETKHIGLRFVDIIKYEVNPLIPDDTSGASCERPLGSHMLQLKNLYHCLRAALDHCYRQGKAPLFRYLKSPIEKLNNRRQFSITQLKQLCWLAPSLLRIQWKGGATSEVLSVIEEQHDAEVQELDENGKVSRLAGDSENSRKIKRFHSICVQWIRKQHQEFLDDNKSLEETKEMREMKCWHPQFPLEKIQLPPPIRCDRLSSSTSTPTRARTRSISPVLLRSLQVSNSPMSNCERTPPTLGRVESPVRCRSPLSNLICTPQKTPKLSPTSPRRVTASEADKPSVDHSNEESFESPAGTPSEGSAKMGKYLDSNALARILEKAERAERAKAIANALSEKDEHIVREFTFWTDSLWVFERLVEDFSSNHRYPLSKVSTLSAKYSTKYGRSISSERVLQCILKLEQLFPRIVSTMKAHGNRGDLTVKFHTSTSCKAATEHLNKLVKASEQNVVASQVQRRTEFTRKWAEEDNGIVDTPIREAIDSPLNRTTALL